MKVWENIQKIDDVKSVEGVVGNSGHLESHIQGDRTWCFVFLSFSFLATKFLLFFFLFYLKLHIWSLLSNLYFYSVPKI